MCKREAMKLEPLLPGDMARCELPEHQQFCDDDDAKTKPPYGLAKDVKRKVAKTIKLPTEEWHRIANAVRDAICSARARPQQIRDLLALFPEPSRVARELGIFEEQLTNAEENPENIKLIHMLYDYRARIHDLVRTPHRRRRTTAMSMDTAAHSGNSSL